MINSRIDFNKIDTSISKNPKLVENGVQIERSFIDKSDLSEINKELDKYFNKPLFNSITGSIWTGNEFFPGKKIIKILPNTSRLRSINILELVVDVANLFVDKNDLVLTSLEIFSEKRNKESLFWHTDARHGMKRAQIYLKGGDNNSGAFEYMQNTHKILHKVNHKLDDEEVSKLKKNIFSCEGNPGDLIIFDSYGFHSKNKCTSERRTLMMEFQPKNLDVLTNQDRITYHRSSVDLNNLSISKKVLDNIGLFLPDNKNIKEYYTLKHGSDFEYNNYPTFFISKTTILIIQKLIKNFLTKPVKAILKKFKFY